VRNISDILAGYYGFWYATDISDIRVVSVTGMFEILVILVLLGLP
jgi:nitrous oxide reductase